MPFICAGVTLVVLIRHGVGLPCASTSLEPFGARSEPYMSMIEEVP
jgi:hypothetical protein